MGRRPASPQAVAGFRIEPEVSEPRAKPTRPAAIVAPRARRRSPAPVIGVPGGPAGTGEAGIGAVVAEAAGELDHGGLPEEDRPRPAEPLDHRGVEVEDLRAERFCPPGCGNPLRGEEVLGPVGDAVEGADVAAGQDLLLRAMRLREGQVARDRDHGREAGTQRVESIEVGLGQLHGADLPPMEQGALFADRCEEHVVLQHRAFTGGGPAVGGRARFEHANRLRGEFPGARPAAFLRRAGSDWILPLRTTSTSSGAR